MATPLVHPKAKSIAIHLKEVLVDEMKKTGLSKTELRKVTLLCQSTVYQLMDGTHVNVSVERILDALFRLGVDVKLDITLP